MTEDTWEHWCHLISPLGCLTSISNLYKGLWIFLGNLLPTQVSSILVNDIAMIYPISQTEDLGVLLDSSLLSCPTCSPPASPVDSHKHTPVHPRAFTSSHSTPGHCLDKFHSLLTNLPASTLEPQQYILQNDLSKTEHTSLLFKTFQ